MATDLARSNEFDLDLAEAHANFLATTGIILSFMGPFAVMSFLIQTIFGGVILGAIGGAIGIGALLTSDELRKRIQQVRNQSDSSTCGCDVTGSSGTTCDTTGKCTCNTGWTGDKCDSCDSTNGYTGAACNECLANWVLTSETCTACNCDATGASGTTCDSAGQCTCNTGYTGTTCNQQCASSYYSSGGVCQACNCDASGSSGTTCNSVGQCTCNTGYTGTTCNLYLAEWIDEKITCKIEMQNVLLNFQLKDIMTNQCPDGWNYINKKCYQLVTETKTWTQARDFCTSLNAKLAEPQTTCESDLLHYHLQLAISQLSSNPTTDFEVEVWIGIQDMTSEGNFIYDSNGNSISVEYWYPGEPNNDAGDEDCVHLYGAYSDGKWNDVDCTANHWSFCERNL